MKAARILPIEAELSEQGYFTMEELAERLDVRRQQAVGIRASLGNAKVLREHSQNMGALYDWKWSKNAWGWTFRMWEPVRVAVRKHMGE